MLARHAQAHRRRRMPELSRRGGHRPVPEQLCFVDCRARGMNVADQGALAAQWAERAKAFNDGATDAWESLFAPDCVWESPQGRIQGASGIQAALNEMRQATGWQTHEVAASS